MRQLLEQFVPHVYRFALRLARNPHDAEDLTQEVMLRAWRRLSRLRDEQAIRVWLFRITINAWRDHCRQRQKRPAIGTLDGHEPDASVASPLSEMAQREEIQGVLDVLDRLAPRQRQVVYLHACEGLSLDEIADVLGIAYAAAKASLAAGRKRLREQWEVRAQRGSSASLNGDMNAT